MTDWDADGNEEAEAEMLREGSRVALQSVAIWAGLEAMLIFTAVWAVRAPILASQQLFTSGSAYWYESCMPAVLFALLGGLLGVLLGWRMTSASGLAGPAGWRIGVLGWSAVGGAAVAAAFMTFSGGVPTFFWVAWTALMIAGVCGVSVHTLWVS